MTPGTTTELPADGGDPHVTTVWRPEPASGVPHRRLRGALTAAVSLRVALDADLTCDLSGGLDSSAVTVLAAAARTSPRPLNAVTVHPQGDLNGGDLRHARLVGDAHPLRIAHHLLPLGVEHLPYTAIETVPPTDEPAPCTLTHARLRGQLDWMREQLNSRTHLTGDGGDSVLFRPPAQLADLVGQRRLTRAFAEALGWARLRHRPLFPLLRDARVLARTSRCDSLTALASDFETANPVGKVSRDGFRFDPGGSRDIRWFTPIPLPSWATPTGARFLADALAEAAADQLPGITVSARVLVDEIREIARTAAADVELAAAHDVSLHNPFWTRTSSMPS